MAYPPELPPATRTDSTISAGNHASDHNRIAAALRAFLEVLGADPAAGYVDLTSRLEALIPDAEQAAIGAVPPLVVQYLADDDAPAQAAALAVDDALENAGVVSGARAMPYAETSVVFAITDADGHRSWLEVSSTGGPSRHALDTLRVALAEEAGYELAKMAETSGYAAVVHDAEGKVAAGLRLDGVIEATVTRALVADNVPELEAAPLTTASVTGATPNRVLAIGNTATGHIARITTGDPHDPRVVPDPADPSKSLVIYTRNGAQEYRREDGSTYPVESNPLLVGIFGDSLTNRGGVRNALRAAMPGVTVEELGAEGQSSSEIIARQGGIDSLTEAQVTIPAGAGSTVVVPLTIDVAWHDVAQPGSLGGVAGTLTSAEDRTHTFTRTNAGSSVVVPAGTPWVSGPATTYESATQILWVGRNDVSAGLGPAPIVANVAAAVARMRPLFKRYLVVSVTPSSNETEGTAGYNRIEATNAALAEAHGDRFVDVRRYVIDNAYAILAAQGVYVEGVDDAAIAGDTWPPSLMLGGGDLLHHSAATQTTIGNIIYDRIETLGWHA